MAKALEAEKQYIDAFLKLTLRPTSAADIFPLLTSLTAEQRRDFEDLANSNHVVVRTFEVINRVAGNRGNTDIQAWAISVLTVERARITKALTQLEQVCQASPHSFAKGASRAKVVRGCSAPGEVRVDAHEAMLKCPLHGWTFSVKDGTCSTDPKFRVRTYPASVRDGRVLVDMSARR